VQRTGIDLSAAFVATVNAEMKVGGLEEAITVTARTPTVDTKSVNQQRTVSRDVIDALPTAKTFGALGALIRAWSSTAPTSEDRPATSARR
jgi:hypothetical protein